MTVPPSPPPGSPGGWNPPPAGTDWSSAPPPPGGSSGYPPPDGGPGYPPPGAYGPAGYGQGEYGPAGYGPAGYGPGGYPPPGLPPAGPKPGTNGFAIAALVLSIIGGIVLSVIFGIIGLNQTRRTGQNGRGLAIAALVISGVWLVAIVGLIIVAVLTSPRRDDSGTIASGGDVSATALQVGDCVNNLKDSSNLLSLPAVPCTAAHEGEVFAVFDLPAGPYPGGDSVPASISDECSSRFADYAPNADPTDIGLYVVYPRAVNWAKGDRTVDCIATANGGTTTGSLKGT